MTKILKGAALVACLLSSMMVQADGKDDGKLASSGIPQDLITAASKINQVCSRVASDGKLQAFCNAFELAYNKLNSHSGSVLTENHK